MPPITKLTTSGAKGEALSKHHFDWSLEPQSIQQWSEFHERIESLPPQEREAFGLLWYQGLGQAEAAKVLNVDVRTVRRRWRSARLMICEAMDSLPPE